MKCPYKPNCEWDCFTQVYECPRFQLFAQESKGDVLTDDDVHIYLHGDSHLSDILNEIRVTSHGNL